MNRLWAPWRIGYIQTKKHKSCIFCIHKKSVSKKYVIIKNKLSFAILNKFPYNNGHVLVAPLRHIKDISQLKYAEMNDLFKTMIEVKDILSRTLKPTGFNIGINISRVAGAGITGHLHIHIVPRFSGDTNFMPVISATRVISQSLDELYKRIKKIRKRC
jgi:ATP adenylyltransferase